MSKGYVAREMTDADLEALGVTPMSDDQMASERKRRDEHIVRIADRVRDRVASRLAAGWNINFALEDALHYATDVGTRREATIQMVTLAGGKLARGWEHSEAFVRYWNALFPFADLVEGFACPATIDLPNGQRGAFIATWSGFLAERRADA